MPPEVLAREAARRKLAFGLQAGLIATLLMTGLLVAAPLLAGWRTSQAAAQTIAQLRAHPLIALAALAAHLTYGAAAGALFTVGARAINVTRAPLVGLGFVASHQPALAAVALPLHVAYGVALGAFAPRGEIVQPLDAAASA